MKVKGKHIPLSVRHEIKSRHANGEHPRLIARSLSVSLPTVYKWARARSLIINTSLVQNYCVTKKDAHTCSMAERRKARWKTMRGVSGVYAYEGVGCFAVKIGWSDNIANRLATSSMYLPFGIELVGWIPDAPKSREREIHDALYAWSLRGEWFAWTDEVREFVSCNFMEYGRENRTVGLKSATALAGNPLLEIDEVDDATAALFAAYQKMNYPQRKLLSRWLDGTRTRPMTLDDLIRIASGDKADVTRERYRQALHLVAAGISQTCDPESIGNEIASELIQMKIPYGASQQLAEIA